MSGKLLNLSSDKRTPDSVSTDDYTIRFASPIVLGNQLWEMSLVTASTWNANPNVSGPLYNNNYFSVSLDSGATWNVITIAEGNYSLQTLNAEITRQIVALGGSALSVVFAPNISTLKVEISADAVTQVDLGTGSFFYELLGYSLAQIAAPLTGFSFGDNVGNINRGVNTILLECDLVDPSSSYNSQFSSEVISDYPFSGRPPGSSISLIKPFQIWLPMKQLTHIDKVRVKLIDQLGRPYSLKGEPLNIQVNIRPRKLETQKTLFKNFEEGIRGHLKKPN